MTRIFRIFVLIGVAAAAGCTSDFSNFSSAEKEKAFKDAQNVAPQNYKADILAFMRTYLNTPDGVREAGISELRKLWVIDAERYAVCLRYNAKDSTGRYTGAKNRVAVFITGKFDRLIELTPDNEQLIPLRDYCATASYQPFPELERLRR